MPRPGLEARPATRAVGGWDGHRALLPDIPRLRLRSGDPFPYCCYRAGPGKPTAPLSQNVMFSTFCLLMTKWAFSLPLWPQVPIFNAL